MGPKHHCMSIVTIESALPGRHDDQRCRAIRIPPWIRAQFALLTTLSVVCAIACSQAEFTLPPFENNLKLQGSGAADLCLDRTGRRLGGPRAFWRCSARATLLSRAVRCRALLCTSYAAGHGGSLDVEARQKGKRLHCVSCSVGWLTVAQPPCGTTSNRQFSKCI